MKQKKLGRMVAPYTLILTPNGSKKAWPPRKTPWKKAGGRVAPRLACKWAKKDGCAQRTGAHERPKPTSQTYFSNFEALKSVLRIRIRDLGSGIGCFLTPGSGIRDPGWEKVSIRIRDPGSGMNNPDHIFLELRNHLCREGFLFLPCNN